MALSNVGVSVLLIFAIIVELYFGKAITYIPFTNLKTIYYFICNGIELFFIWILQEVFQLLLVHICSFVMLIHNQQIYRFPLTFSPFLSFFFD